MPVVYEAHVASVISRSDGELHLQKGQHVASSKPVVMWPHDKLEKSSSENLLFSYRRC